MPKLHKNPEQYHTTVRLQKRSTFRRLQTYTAYNKPSEPSSTGQQHAPLEQTNVNIYAPYHQYQHQVSASASSSRPGALQTQVSPNQDSYRRTLGSYAEEENKERKGAGRFWDAEGKEKKRGMCVVL